MAIILDLQYLDPATGKTSVAEVKIDGHSANEFIARDPQRYARTPSWKPRDAAKVRERHLSPTTIALARPHVLAELMRRAKRPRWAGVDARTFLEEMMEKSR